MEKRIKDVIFSILSILLWFAPFNSVVINTGIFKTGRSMQAYQTGPDLGAFALLLLVIPIAYGYTAWNEQKELNTITAFTQLLVCLLFLVPRIAAGNVSYGIVLLSLLAIVFVIRSSPLSLLKHSNVSPQGLE